MTKKKYLILVNDKCDKGEPVGLFSNTDENYSLLSEVPWCYPEETDENKYNLGDVDKYLGKITEIVRDGLLPYGVYSEQPGSYSPLTGEPYMCMDDIMESTDMKGEADFYLWAKDPQDAVSRAKSIEGIRRR